MIQITYEVFKANWKRYLWSSVVTFSSAFVFALAFIFKSADLSSISDSGFVGGVAIVVRFVVKALLEAFREFIFWLAIKVK